MPRHYDGPPATFTNLIDQQDFLYPYCLACLRMGSAIDPRPLADKYGADRSVTGLAKLLKCTHCGVKGRATTHRAPPPGCPPLHTRSIGAYEWWDAQPARDVLAGMKR